MSIDGIVGGCSVVREGDGWPLQGKAPSACQKPDAGASKVPNALVRRPTKTTFHHANDIAQGLMGNTLAVMTIFLGLKALRHEEEQHV